jgi:hypothetical protein
VRCLSTAADHSRLWLAIAAVIALIRELTGLSLQHLTVRLSDASRTKVQVDQTTAAQVSGASSLIYLGTPRFTKRDASANSTIRSA